MVTTTAALERCRLMMNVFVSYLLFTEAKQGQHESEGQAEKILHVAVKAPTRPPGHEDICMGFEVCFAVEFV